MICIRRFLFTSKKKVFSLTFQTNINLHMLRDMKRSAHFKAVFDDSWITVDTTSLHRHKLCYCTIALICRILKLNSTSCVIQGPDQDLAGTHQRLRDSMSGRAEVWFRSLTKRKINPFRARTALGPRPHGKKTWYDINVNVMQLLYYTMNNYVELQPL